MELKMKACKSKLSISIQIKFPALEELETRELEGNTVVEVAGVRGVAGVERVEDFSSICT